MFARVVRMKLKPNSTKEFTQVLENEVILMLQRQQGFRDEISFLAPDGREAIGISLWDEKLNAEAYNRQAYPDVQKAVGKVTEGVKTYEVANSTFHKIAVRAAA